MNEIVKLASDQLEIEVWSLGARLNGVWFQGIGSLVDGSSNEDEARGTKKYNGATVGPVANRIAGGRAALDGTDFSFERNENDATTLHSGATGVHAQNWTVLDRQPNRLVMELKLADGLGGFPGNRSLQAEYTLFASHFDLRFTATTDAPTWMNLALHPYWSLGVGRDALELGVNALSYTPVDAAQIPSGDIAPVADTQFDLRSPTAAHPTIDHNFDLIKRAGAGSAITLRSRTVQLDIETDAPGVQIYAGKPIGIAIEPQHWPDAMHHTGFPSIELRPGKTYSQVSTYRFSRL